MKNRTPTAGGSFAPALRCRILNKTDRFVSGSAPRSGAKSLALATAPVFQRAANGGPTHPEQCAFEWFQLSRVALDHLPSRRRASSDGGRNVDADRLGRHRAFSGVHHDGGVPTRRTRRQDAARRGHGGGHAGGAEAGTLARRGCQVKSNPSCWGGEDCATHRTRDAGSKATHKPMPLVARSEKVSWSTSVAAQVGKSTGSDHPLPGEAGAQRRRRRMTKSETVLVSQPKESTCPT